MEGARTLANTAYSHDSGAKQWPRYCEAQDKNCVDQLYISALL